MTLLEAVRLAVAADDAFDPDKGGPAYDLMDEAHEQIATVLARRPGASGALVDAARAYVSWAVEDTAVCEDVDWARYDAAVAQCRAAVAPFALEEI